MKFKALLLDLDGTLVDTAPDMVGTLNRLLHRHGEQSVAEDTAAKHVSNGARALLNFGFSDAPQKPALKENLVLELVEEFLLDYADHTYDKSKPYEGMLDVLNACNNNDIRWGVVTNKPFMLSRTLLNGLNLLDDCSVLLGGDSLAVKKPNPAPLLHCCMTLSLAASECLYVGDHKRDIEAGNSAGMDTAAALWGYIEEDQTPESWGANYLTSSPTGLLQLIQERIDS
jgi:phosphoglycolate phosphatase